MPNGRPPDAEKKIEFMKWFDNIDKGKESRDEICLRLKVHRNTLMNWAKEIRITRMAQGTDDESRAKRVKDELYNVAISETNTSAKVKALELYARMSGLITDEKTKQEKAKGVTKDDINDIARGAEDRLNSLRKGLNNGTAGLQAGPGVLPQPVRDDGRPSAAQTDKVGTVALPCSTA